MPLSKILQATLLLSAVIWPASVFAVTLSAKPGFNGHFYPGRWTPIHVTIENLPRADKARADVREFNGTCEVHAGGFSAAPDITFSRPIQVPVGDRKRITLYAILSSATEVEVRLVDKSGRRVESTRVPVKPIVQGERLVAYVDFTGTSFVVPKIPDLPDVITASIAPEDLPDKWYGYDSVSLLVVPRITDQLFDTDKLRALEHWIGQGGDALFIGGRYGQSYRGSRVEKLLPGTYLSNDAFRWEESRLVPVGDVSDPGTANLVLTKLMPAADSFGLFSIGETPILTARNIGVGRALFLATDWPPRLPAEFPLARLLGLHLRTKPRLDGVKRRFNDEFFFRNFAVYDLGTASLLPNHGFIFLILLSYLIIIGPLNFYILHRKRRLELAWLTVPAIVIVYTGGIFGMSSALKGTGSHLRTFNLLTGRAGSPTYRCEGVSMLFLPSPGSHRMDVDDPEAAMTQHVVWEGDGRSAGGFAARPVVVEQTAKGMRLPHKFIRQWDTDFTRVDSIVEMGPIEVDLKVEADAISGEIRNHTTGAIGELSLCVANQMYHIRREKDLKGLLPGEKTAFRLPMNEVVQRYRDHHPLTGSPSESLVSATFIDTAIPNIESDLPACVLIGKLQKELPELKTPTAVTSRKQHAYFALEVPIGKGELPPPQVARSAKRDSRPFWQAVQGPSQMAAPGSAGSVFILNGLNPPADASSMELTFAYSPKDAFNSLLCEYFDPSAAAWKPLQLTPLPVKRVPSDLHDGNAGAAQIRFDNVINAVHTFEDSMLLKLKGQGFMTGNLRVTSPVLRHAPKTREEP